MILEAYIVAMCIVILARRYKVHSIKSLCWMKYNSIYSQIYNEVISTESESELWYIFYINVKY